MSFRKMTLTTLTCRSCRNALLNSLLPEIVVPTYRHTIPLARQSGRKSFNTSSNRSEGVEHAASTSNVVDTNDMSYSVEKRRDLQKTKVNAQDTSLPWYLRESAGAFRERNLPDAMAERQRLPDPPPFAPPILQPLLEHTSVDIGLDDLCLLDLRRIDPPPALGSNLLMIIGTARSEKHLHVSADRLCRWLRSTYKLRPEADGLLGRNELKLKLKRRNRRMKMLASVNAIDRPDRDDGISTNWVCVNVGQVEPAADAPDFIQRKPGFVGFGSQTKKVTLVVQMLTEEKRNEMDLEGLWNTVQKVKDMNQPEVESDPLDAGKLLTASSTSISERGISRKNEPKSKAPNKPASFLDRPVTMDTIQTRGYHVDTRSYRSTRENEFAKPLEVDRIGSTFGEASKNSTEDLLNQLVEMKHADALLSLGKHAKDWSSIKFLYDFYKSIPAFPEMIHWECLAEFYLHALKLRHPGYTVEDMNSLMLKAQLAGVDISERFFVKAFEAMLLPIADQIAKGQPVRASLAKASKVMEKMEHYGHDPLSDRMILSLNTSITPTSVSSGDDAWRELTVTLHDQLHDVMDAAGVTPMENRFYEQLLASCAQLGHWRGFWNVWHGVARRSLARSAELYRLAFAAVADTGHQSRCLAALRYCVPQMRKENPPVRIEDDLAGAIKSCVLVAEPDIENQAASGTFVEGEFVSLWNRCKSLLGER